MPRLNFIYFLALGFILVAPQADQREVWMSQEDWDEDLLFDVDIAEGPLGLRLTPHMQIEEVLAAGSVSKTGVRLWHPSFLCHPAIVSLFVLISFCLLGKCQTNGFSYRGQPPAADRFTF